MSVQPIHNRLSFSSVTFVTVSGHRSQARVKELRADSLTFELLASENRLQLSEVLQDAEVVIEGKVAYQGELSVKGCVQTGAMMVCEARISGNWLLDPFGTDVFLDNIADHLEEHTTRWAKEHEVSPAFRASVADLETYFAGLESWCERVERGALSNRNDAGEREEQILGKLGPIVSLEVASHFAEYERIVGKLNEEDRAVHRDHLMRTVHRFVLQSPFSYRCFTKPLGFAGDYGMVRLMLGNPYQGATLFGKLINFAFMDTGPVVAHQNRINYLVDTLRSVVSERAGNGQRTRILNLGCGPAEEVQRFIAEEAVSDSCDFELLDFNSETLRYTEQQITEVRRQHGRETNVKFIEDSIQGFLRHATRGGVYDQGGYDFVYCAGLFDYLQQRFCAKLTSAMCGLVGEGGLVAVTNVSTENTIPSVMADFLEWVLIERNRQEMLELAPAGNLSFLKELKSDSTRINLFLELRRKARERHVGTPEEFSSTQVG